MDTGLVEVTGTSEFHHSLAMANLIDGADSTDGWGAGNRGAESSVAEPAATETQATTGSAVEGTVAVRATRTHGWFARCS